jgi:hypothetical protein
MTPPGETAPSPAELFERVQANDVEGVRRALAASKGLVAARDGALGSTPLHFAANGGLL